MLLFSAGPAMGQKTVWHDAVDFPLYGKASDSTLTRYERLPASYQTVSRTPVWNLGRNSAGLAVRFRSDSPFISARWTSMFKNDMNHMTSTGVRGLDLYVLCDGEWVFAGAGRPKDKTTEASLVSGMPAQEREYMLYLSLYDGIDSLSIGISPDSFIAEPLSQLPDRSRPIIMYGTSILQGGCASRPGMAHTNIIGRRLNSEVINLGFSGNALLDMEIAELMASVESPGLFVLDYVPNASADMIDKKGEAFFRVLRDRHPDVPVIFIEDPIFPHSRFDKVILAEITKKNLAQKTLYEKLRAQGEKHIYYIPAVDLIGTDGEATVDGIHFTDLGMERYVDRVLPVIKKAIKKQKK